jgi:hypothetical protein
VDIAIQMGKIRQPLSVGETITLANSLISGSLHQLKLIEWKKWIYPDIREDSYGKLGTGCWEGFIRPHGRKLVTKHGEQFASDRADWSKEIYIQ